jgi:hypothetical protein
MSGIGPVEPVDSRAENGSYEVVGRDPVGFEGRWGALRPGLRRALLAGATALAAAGIGLAAVLTAPGDEAGAADRTPFPANVTAWRYLGLTAGGGFRFAVDVSAGPPVVLEVTAAEFAGLDARAIPEPRFTVPAGRSREVTVEISVSDCSAVQPNLDFPFLDVTLRNTRAMQRHSYIFGAKLSQDLSALVHRACDQQGPRTIPRPSGSAGSQNAD